MAFDKKFGVPFSGAADMVIGGEEEAARAAAFPTEQVDESRKGAMRGEPKFAKDSDCEMMQSTGKSEVGYSPWKKMELF